MLRHTAEVCTQHCTDCHQATDEFHELANLFSSFFFFFSSTLSPSFFSPDEIHYKDWHPVSAACFAFSGCKFGYNRIFDTSALTCVQVADLPLHTSAWIPTAVWQMHLPFTVYQGALHSTCPVSGAQAVPGVLQSPWSPP